MSFTAIFKTNSLNGRHSLNKELASNGCSLISPHVIGKIGEDASPLPFYEEELNERYMISLHRLVAAKFAVMAKLCSRGVVMERKNRNPGLDWFFAEENRLNGKSKTDLSHEYEVRPSTVMRNLKQIRDDVNDISDGGPHFHLAYDALKNHLISIEAPLESKVEELRELENDCKMVFAKLLENCRKREEFSCNFPLRAFCLFLYRAGRTEPSWPRAKIREVEFCSEVYEKSMEAAPPERREHVRRIIEESLTIKELWS